MRELQGGIHSDVADIISWVFFVGIGKSLLVYVPEGAFSPAGEENPN
jgi:hypothetical protein